jgi:hypothetical protein
MSGRRSRRSETAAGRFGGPRWRARAAPIAPPALDQEQEVRAKLYAKPPATERTVEVLGPVARMAERPAA